MSYVTAFVASAATDIVLVKYIKAVSLDQAERGAVLSMMMAMLLLMGITEAFHDFNAACFWVGGYGFGSWIAIKSNAKTKTA